MLRQFQASIATIAALAVCIATELIGRSGWFSTISAFRAQTDAFFTGHLRLSPSPAAIEHDFAWAGGGVQQAWGLGVPAWRFLFECLARLVGQPAFPDRLALAFAIALNGFLLLRVLSTAESTDDLRAWRARIGAHPERLAAVALLVFFPPMLALYRGTFNVYEEAVAYSYLFSTGLFAGLLAFRRNPTTRLYLAVSLMSGLAGFFRPTMLAYGLSTMVLVFLQSRLLGWKWRDSIRGWGLFVLAGSLLYGTNKLRFGSGTEFGHSLQLSSIDLMYVSRFHAPFFDESLWPALKELAGSLFFVQRLNSFDVYGGGIVRWQAPALRWRHFYVTTYDASFLVLVTAAFLLIAWQTVRARRVAASLRKPGDSVLAAAWSLASLGLLSCFYARHFAFSSRYALDFAPAFAVAIAGCLSELGTILPPAVRRRKVAVDLALGIVAAWGVWQIGTFRRCCWKDTACSRQEIGRRERVAPEAVPPLPDQYETGMNFTNRLGIGHNGRGWFWESGETESMAVFFVDSPGKIVLDVAGATGAVARDSDFSAIRAKIGWEFLRLRATEPSGAGRRLIFHAPRRAAHRTGIQMLSISFVPPREFTRQRSRFRLLRVRWKPSAVGESARANGGAHQVVEAG